MLWINQKWPISRHLFNWKESNNCTKMFEKSSTDCAGAKILGQPGSSLYFLEEVRGPSERGCQNRIQLTSANQASKQKQASQDKRGKDIQNDIMWLSLLEQVCIEEKNTEKRGKRLPLYFSRPYKSPFSQLQACLHSIAHPVQKRLTTREK